MRPTLRSTAMEIRDNGTGFTPPDEARPLMGLGLLLMEHYARQVGLDFSVKSTIGKGTIIKASHRTSVSAEPTKSATDKSRGASKGN